MTADTAELRLEVPRADLAILDGYCCATGRSRADVVRELLARWSQDKRHEAIIVCRTAGINPLAPEGDRK